MILVFRVSIGWDTIVVEMDILAALTKFSAKLALRGSLQITLLICSYLSARTLIQHV